MENQKFRVRLVKDLSHLHPGLVKGSIGTHTQGRSYGAWGRTAPLKYWGVKFDNGRKIDIRIKYLEFYGDGPFE